MKKLLFVSNICKNITNFHTIPMQVLNDMGYEFHFAANFDGMPQKVRESYPKIIFHHLNLRRFPFHPQNIKAYKEIKAVAQKENFEAIHCNTPIGGILGRVCGKMCGVPKVIYTAHGFHFYKGAPIKNWLLYYPGERMMAHWSDTIITMNKEDYEAAQKFKLRNKGKVYYVPGVGIDTQLYKDVAVDRDKLRASLGLKSTDVACISMGDLIPRKNYATAIKAIAKCKNVNIHYFICGKGSELENLQKLAKENGVENRIHFLGFRSDIKELLKAVDVFLFTTLQEGMPRSMMEAMASGLPCIASKIRGNVDLLEDGVGGYLVPVTDDSAISDKLELLAENKELRLKMSAANLERIKSFDVSEVKKEIEKIYKEVLA